MSASGAGRSTLVNALVGAAVTVVLSFVPFSSIVGGAVAGYLQRGDVGEGATVGAIAGFLAMIPWALFLFLAGGVLAFGMMGAAPRGFLFGGLGIVSILLFLGVYVIGLSVVGGVVGAYVAAETGDAG